VLVSTAIHLFRPRIPTVRLGHTLVPLRALVRFAVRGGTHGLAVRSLATMGGFAMSLAAVRRLR
jgi:hypothetical protein